jgi:Tfp pilus assembly PilM family ATPase
MATSVYITPHTITAVDAVIARGAVRVRGCRAADTPAGAVSGGAVADPDALAAALGALGLPRRVRLIIDGDALTARTLTVPPMPPGETLRHVGHVMGALEPDAGLTGDYAELPAAPDGARRIYAVAAPRAEIALWQAAVRRAGSRAVSINLATPCAARAFRRYGPADAPAGAWMLALLDGPGLSAYLFAEGRLMYAGQRALSERRGDASAAVEIARGLSAMAQYRYGAEGRAVLGGLSLYGLMGDETEFLGDIAEALLGPGEPPVTLRALALPEGVSAPGGVICLGDLIP